MTTLTLNDLVLMMIILIFILGGVTFAAGLLLLVFRASGKEVRTIAAQTTQLAQKGISEDIVGLVGNATNLLNALQQLIRTTAGIGAFLTLLGLIIMGGACLLAYQLFRLQR